MHTSEDGYVASVFCFVLGGFLICDLTSRLCEDTVEDIVFFSPRGIDYIILVSMCIEMTPLS